MTADEFETKLRSALRTYFPDAKVTIKVQRGVLVDARIRLSDDLFIDVYFHALTQKHAYALIYRQQRRMGYDNYKFWHRHPLENPQKHEPCEPPTVEAVMAEMVKAIDILVTEVA
ncbi:MAG: hypothetical protein ISS49_13130 [Anaerolineae bacterium]|nr:hypothetical protein [Anaerolineae bacterium]